MSQEYPKYSPLKPCATEIILTANTLDTEAYLKVYHSISLLIYEAINIEELENAIGFYTTFIADYMMHAYI